MTSGELREGVSDLEQRCRVCATQLDPDRPWWWTSYGAACSSPCARDLIRDHEGGAA